MRRRKPVPRDEYEAFQSAIAAVPYDVGHWQMYIDWLTEQDRLREAAVARLAMQQRLHFGPTTPDFWQRDHRFDTSTIVRRFTLSCRSLVGMSTVYERFTDRWIRFSSRCEFETRQSPKSGLWEFRVVGPDPGVHPLDCPPNDERRRFTQWKPYPDEWFVVAVLKGGWSEWEPLTRYRLSNHAAVHAKDVSSVHTCRCVVRDQNGRLCYRYRDGMHVVGGPDFPMGLPEDLYPVMVV